MNNVLTNTFSVSLGVESPPWLHPDTLANLRSQVREKRVWTCTFSKGERAVLRTRKPIPASQWATQHRVLHLSSIPGRWNNAVTPYTTGIMDASFFPSVQKVVIMKCPQSGGTEAVHNCVGYAIDRAPGPVLYVFPSQDVARENAQDRIIPMLTSSPRLSSYLTGTSDDVSALRISMAHMTIHMAWSGSASRLGNKPIRYLVLDELDKYQNLKKETSSESLARKRTITWGRRSREWDISTPTVVNGPIHTGFMQAEARLRYYVVCPHCGCELLMDFDNIHWPADVQNPVLVKSQTLAWYDCQHCHAHWTDADRDRAVRAGLWRDEATGQPLQEYLETHQPMTIAFHIPAWISPFVSLSEIAEIALQSTLTSDEKVKQDLANNYKAEPWEPEYEKRSEDMILALCDDRPRGTVPGPLLINGGSRERVACLLASVDTQLRYFRYVIRAFGFGEEGESWLIQEGVAPTIAALDKLFWHSEYLDPNKKVFKVRAAIIDAMGDPTRTGQVYLWASKNRGRVFPSQGVHAPSSPVSYAPQEYFPGPKGERVKIPGGILLHRVDTTLFKGTLAHKLAIAPADPGAFHLHTSDKDALLGYAKEMSAEVWDREKNLWVNPHSRPNHAFDCEYLLQALYWQLNVAKMRRPDAQKPALTNLPPMPPPTGARNIANRLSGLARR